MSVEARCFSSALVFIPAGLWVPVLTWFVRAWCFGAVRFWMLELAPVCILAVSCVIVFAHFNSHFGFSHFVWKSLFFVSSVLCDLILWRPELVNKNNPLRFHHFLLYLLWIWKKGKIEVKCLSFTKLVFPVYNPVQANCCCSSFALIHVMSVCLPVIYF